MSSWHGVRNRQRATFGTADTSYTEQDINNVQRILQCGTNYHRILLLSRACTEQEIRSAYKQMCRQIHPDKNKAPGADEAFKALTKAHDVLIAAVSQPQPSQHYGSWSQNSYYGENPFSQGPQAGRSYSQGPQGGSSYSQGSQGGSSYSQGPQGASSYSQGPQAGRSYSQGPQGGSSYSQGPQAGRSYSQGPQGASSYSQGPQAGRSYSQGHQDRTSHSHGPQTGPSYSYGTQSPPTAQPHEGLAALYLFCLVVLLAAVYVLFHIAISIMVGILPFSPFIFLLAAIRPEVRKFLEVLLEALIHLFKAIFHLVYLTFVKFKDARWPKQ